MLNTPESRPVLSTNRGFTLIEVLIASAIGIIVCLSFTSILTAQQREMRWLFNKADVLETKTNLMRALQNQAVCSWQLKDKEFSAVGVTSSIASQTEISLDQIYEGLDTTSKVLLRQRGPLSGSNDKLSVTKIAISNIVDTGIAGLYAGDLQIYFTDATNSRAYQPVTVALRLQTASPSPTVRKIVACGSDNAPVAPEGSCDWYSNFNADVQSGTAVCTQVIGHDVRESEVPASERSSYVWQEFSTPKVARRKYLKQIPNGFWVPSGVVCTYEQSVGCGANWLSTLSCAGGVAIPVYKQIPCSDQGG